ncbi:MAG: hypothetical protein ABFD82_20115 [Syntrophaceae bacterium]
MEKDQLEIILEDIRGKFDLVLEGHDGLRKEIQDTRQELCEKISLVDIRVEALNLKIGGVESNLNQKISGVESNLNQKIGDVESSLNKKIGSVESNLNKKIDNVENNLNKKINRVQDDLNKKIDSVESRLSEKIDAVASDLSAHRRDTEAHSTIYKVKDER